MSDLTEVELEAMEKRCALVKRAKYLPVRESLIITTEDIEQMTRTDLPALIAALREARGERDGMSELYAREGHKSLVLLNENTSLLAENRLLREWLNKATTKLCRLNIAWTWPSPDIARLTAAEAERVRRMERVWHTLNSIEDETDGVCPMCGSEWGCNIDCTFCTLAALAALGEGESCPET